MIYWQDTKNWYWIVACYPRIDKGTMPKGNHIVTSSNEEQAMARHSPENISIYSQHLVMQNCLEDQYIHVIDANFQQYWDSIVSHYSHSGETDKLNLHSQCRAARWPSNVKWWILGRHIMDPGPRLNIKTVLSTDGDFHVKDKTAVRTSYL